MLEAEDTGASVLQKKKVFKNVLGNLQKQKKGLQKFSARLLAFSNKILTIQQIVLPRAEDRAIFENLRLRGQGLQNVSSKLRTSSRTPPVVLAIQSD